MARISQDDILIERYIREAAIKRKEPDKAGNLYNEIKPKILELANIIYCYRIGHRNKKYYRTYLLLSIINKLMNVKDPNDIFKVTNMMLEKMSLDIFLIAQTKQQNLSAEEQLKYKERMLSNKKHPKVKEFEWNVF